MGYKANNLLKGISQLKACYNVGKNYGKLSSSLSKVTSVGFDIDPKSMGLISKLSSLEKKMEIIENNGSFLAKIFFNEGLSLSYNFEK